mmetsp:Transcript_4904/g.14732  ORF Transcript_4904/g.14732 Transcript_4904/m.14732 type:complete len:335 (+) Transcript_4904:135-1139(+)
MQIALGVRPENPLSHKVSAPLRQIHIFRLRKRVDKRSPFLKPLFHSPTLGLRLGFAFTPVVCAQTFNVGLFFIVLRAAVLSLHPSPPRGRSCDLVLLFLLSLFLNLLLHGHIASRLVILLRLFLARPLRSLGLGGDLLCLCLRRPLALQHGGPPPFDVGQRGAPPLDLGEAVVTGRLGRYNRPTGRRGRHGSLGRSLEDGGGGGGRGDGSLRLDLLLRLLFRRGGGRRTLRSGRHEGGLRANRDAISTRRKVALTSTLAPLVSEVQVALGERTPLLSQLHWTGNSVACAVGCRPEEQSSARVIGLGRPEAFGFAFPHGRAEADLPRKCEDAASA